MDRREELRRIQSLRDAMQDLLKSPMGVVPKSSETLYDFKRGEISTGAIKSLLKD